MTVRRPICVVGAGLSGATVARVLAEAGLPVQVVEQRDHLAGNCHTYRDGQTGILVHKYGPHIFHTDRPEVWQFVNRFATFERYEHRVKTTVGGRVFGLPINLQTLNQFFERAMTPAEAEAFVTSLCVLETEVSSFETRARATVGDALYKTFFEGYTRKQWGVDPARIPAQVFSRLPVRFSYDDRYFSHRFQAMPSDGYTALVAAMLAHPLISVSLCTPYDHSSAQYFEHVFFSGTLDGFFGADAGRLPYRTLDFDRHTGEGDFQGCAVMNYADAHVPHTRITEHKHFAPWEEHAQTVYSIETPRAAGPSDIPYYPLRAVSGEGLFRLYSARAAKQCSVTFLGRLGTFRYLDMDVAIAEALHHAQSYLRRCGLAVEPSGLNAERA